MKKKVFIDCDPGLDDFLALLTALKLPQLEVVGVAATAGNLPLETTSRNVAKILELAGRTDVPYAEGSVHPLLRPQITAEEYHGKSGIGTIALPEPKVRPVAEEGPDFIWKCAKENPGLTLITLGPLTDAARALLGHPDLAQLLGEVVMMGGAHAHGNATQKAEFNILADPHAAHIVFDSGVPITMVGLDTTLARGLTPAEYQEWDLTSPVGRYAAQALENISDCACRNGAGETAYAHDLTAVLCMVHPEVFELCECRVDVELKGRLTLGQTVCDVTGVSGRTPNASVAMGLDEETYLTLLRQTLESL